MEKSNRNTYEKIYLQIREPIWIYGAKEIHNKTNDGVL